MDFQPYGDCDEGALVEEFVRTAPTRSKSKKKRKICPIAASSLFNKGGPHITGSVNMKTIKDYEISTAAIKAAKAEKKRKERRKK